MTIIIIYVLAAYNYLEVIQARQVAFSSNFEA